MDLQAVLVLKLAVNECWFHSENFMSPWQQPNQNKGVEISQQNKEFLKANVF